MQASAQEPSTSITKIKIVLEINVAATCTICVHCFFFSHFQNYDFSIIFSSQLLQCINNSATGTNNFMKKCLIGEGKLGTKSYVTVELANYVTVEHSKLTSHYENKCIEDQYINRKQEA